MNREERLRERLRSLPNPEPPSGGWLILEHTLRARKQQRVRVAFAIAASVLLSFSAMLLIPKQEPIAPARNAPNELAQADVGALMARSRALETHLAQMRESVPVWDERSAARAAALEGELSLVDVQLPYAQPPAAQRLWRDRVVLLNKLVRTHQNAGLINASYVASTEDHL